METGAFGWEGVVIFETTQVAAPKTSIDERNDGLKSIALSPC